MNSRRERIVWIVLLALLVLGDAHASHCMHRAYTHEESVEMFGAASDVFVGVLERITVEKRASRHGGACQDEAVPPELDDIVITSGGWSRSDTVGTFRVVRRYKGEPVQRVRVRINPDLKRGARYLVYANAEDGELRADAHCWPRALTVGPQIEAYLAHLDHLPAAGSGGAVGVSLRTVVDHDGIGKTALAFASATHRFAVVTDADGFAAAPSLPAGRYRLLTQAPPGYRYVCGDDDACAALDVVDRGRVDWNVTLQPRAQLTIRLETADGQAAPVHAHFVLLDPRTGDPREWRENRMYSGTVEPGQRTGFAVPGDVVVALELQRIERQDWRHVVVERRRVYSGGAASLAEAPVATLADGDTTYRFVLPDTLRPVRTRLLFDGVERPPYGTLQLHASTPNGVLPIADVAVRDAVEQGFLALPGQSWQLAVYAQGQHGERWLYPVEDGVVTIVRAP